MVTESSLGLNKFQDRNIPDLADTSRPQTRIHHEANALFEERYRVIRAFGFARALGGLPQPKHHTLQITDDFFGDQDPATAETTSRFLSHETLSELQSAVATTDAVITPEKRFPRCSQPISFDPTDDCPVHLHYGAVKHARGCRIRYDVFILNT